VIKQLKSIFRMTVGGIPLGLALCLAVTDFAAGEPKELTTKNRT
jgi:hypothetical protein